MGPRRPLYGQESWEQEVLGPGSEFNDAEGRGHRGRIEKGGVKKADPDQPAIDQHLDLLGRTGG